MPTQHSRKSLRPRSFDAIIAALYILAIAFIAYLIFRPEKTPEYTAAQCDSAVVRMSRHVYDTHGRYIYPLKSRRHKRSHRTDSITDSIAARKRHNGRRTRHAAAQHTTQQNRLRNPIDSL